MLVHGSSSPFARSRAAGLAVLIGLCLSGLACPGSSGSGGRNNENASENRNDNRANANDNLVENDNGTPNVNDNQVENLNDNTPSNQNANGNDNAAANENDNTAPDDNDNAGGNDNTAGNGNANENDNTAPAGLPPDSQRAAFQSQCAQNVITCTTSFPTAVLNVGLIPGQFITITEGGTKVRIQGADGNGVELVQLLGSGSTAGQGATQIFYSWSAGAADPDPCTLAPGTEFSTEADPQVLLQAGFHYIRLTVTNDLPPIDSVDAGACGTFTDYQRQDFEEIEIEVVD